MQHNLDLIKALEEELFKQSVRGSPEAVSNLLADSFVEFGRSGRMYEKEEVVRRLAAESIEAQETHTARDFVLRPLADDVVLLTYRSFRLAEVRKIVTPYEAPSGSSSAGGGRWYFIKGHLQSGDA